MAYWFTSDSAFKKGCYVVIRQPIESGSVTIALAAISLYPARFTLVAAMNACPCGYFGDADHDGCWGQ